MPKNEQESLRTLPMVDVVREFPEVAEWFDDPAHIAAQVSRLDGRRIASAEERIEMAGGRDVVSGTFAQELRRRHFEPVILQAAKNQPIVTTEIFRYAKLLGAKDTGGNLAKISVSVAELGLGEGLLKEAERVIYIHRGRDPAAALVQMNRIGWQTTQEGIGELSQYIAERPRERRVFAVFSPRPQGA